MATNRPSPPTDPFGFVAGRRDWRVELEREYGGVAERLQAAYGRVLPGIQQRAQALVDAARRLEADTGAPVTLGQIRGLAQYQDLIARIEVEMRDFAAITRNEAAGLQGSAAQIGLSEAFDAVGAQSQIAAGAWMRPNPEALARLIDYVDGEAMRGKFASFGSNAGQDFADLMISLTAQGKNARAIAAALNGWLNVPFVWAETMTRTTQNYSYRMATGAAYQANRHLLDGWIWRAALDVRTCMSCIAQHGTVHPVDEVLNDHHRGRCAMVPLVKGTTWARGIESGQAWFERLPEGTQRRMAGDLLWTALREGDASWSNLSKPYDDDVFGTMLREASVRDLVDDPRRYAALTVLAQQLPRNGTSFEQAAMITAEARAGR